jgi:hypothetical protein
MSQAIRVQSIVHRNGSAISGAKNRLINASKHLPITNPSAAVSRPTQPPITGLNRHRLDAANERLDDLIAAGRGLRQQWADAEHWRQLARERGYRLPHRYQPMTPKGMEQVLRSLGLDRQFYRKAFGLKTYQDLIDRNRDVPLWVFAGWCLEFSMCP